MLLRDLYLKKHIYMFFTSCHSIDVHPQYDAANIDFDYAIITLVEEIDFSLESTRHIRPACQPLAPVQPGEDVRQLHNKKMRKSVIF